MNHLFRIFGWSIWVFCGVLANGKPSEGQDKINAAVQIDPKSAFPGAKWLELKKGDLQLLLSSPGDSANYRGTRFDYSGMFHQITFGKHSLCERWRPGAPNPGANDDVTGPCEEFGNSEPIGYVKKRPGSPFLKMGVGVLKQPEEEDYRFWFDYDVLQRGQWTVRQMESAIEFQQNLSLEIDEKAFGYDYVKTVRIVDSGFQIGHEIRNTGKEPWSTDHYNHNFFLVDSDPVGPNYELRLPFTVSPTKLAADFKTLVKVQGKAISYFESVASRSFFAQLDGHSNQVADNRFELVHQPSRVMVRCTCDQPLSKFNFWGTGKTICPEPFIQISLKPGESFRWTWSYQLQIVDSTR